MTSTPKLCTIMPALSMPGTPTPTHGTRVVLPDGSDLGGVTSIVITGKVNDVWRATIDCVVSMDDMAGVEVKLVPIETPLTWWRCLLLRLAGIGPAGLERMRERQANYIAVMDRWNRQDNHAESPADPSSVPSADAGAPGAHAEPAGDTSTTDEQRRVAADT